MKVIVTLEIETAGTHLEGAQDSSLKAMAHHAGEAIWREYGIPSTKHVHIEEAAKRRIL